jgi:predicted dehydrogenase
MKLLRADFQPKGTLMNKPLRIGLIGAGMVSRHHLTCSGASPAEKHYDLAAEYQGSYVRTIAHFVQSLRDDTPFETAPEDNIETLRLVEDCYRLSGWEAKP